VRRNYRRVLGRFRQDRLKMDDDGAGEGAGPLEQVVPIGNRKQVSHVAQYIGRHMRANQRVHDAERIARRWHRHCPFAVPSDIREQPASGNTSPASVDVMTTNVSLRRVQMQRFSRAERKFYVRLQVD
jgi:hypothetical protein